MDSTTLEMALKYNSLGISTIPLAPTSKHPPRGFRWKQYQERRPTITELHDWHDRTEFGLAVICGKVSGGLIVRDFDKPGAYERFRHSNSALCNRLPAVATGRPGGVHLYARSARTEHYDLSDGELRGEGHYVAAPNSVHHSGIRYRWFHPLIDIPTIDDPSVLIGSAHRKSAHRSPDGAPTPLSLRDTQLLCPTAGLGGAVASAISSTLPKRYGTRNICLLAFCRLLRGLYPSAKPDEMLPYVQAWHQQALPMICTKDFETTWREFQCAFPRTRRGGGGPLWRSAVATADQLDLPENTDHARLVRLCLALHQVHGGAAFPLGCRKAAEYLGIGHDAAARMLDSLVARGMLQISKTYPKNARRANEYRFVIGGGR